MLVIPISTYLLLTFINYPKLPIIVIIKPPIISGHFGYDSP